MLLKPFDEEPQVEVLPPSANLNGILSALNEAGIEVSDEEIDSGENHIQQIFKAQGAGVQDAARTIASVLRAGDSDAAKLKAAEYILKVHNVLTPETDEGDKKPVFNITFVGNGNKNVMNILLPTT